MEASKKPSKRFLPVALVVGFALIAGCSVSGALIAQMLLIHSSEANVQILGGAMEPNYHDEQIVKVEQVSPSDLERGDVIVFTVGKNEMTMIKRLIGLPGEVVEIRDGKVFIDGQELDEPYDVVPTSSEYRFGPIMLGENEFFVLGDNWRGSNDSRFFGPISGASIERRVVP